MAYYIDDRPGDSKESFLRREGTSIPFNRGSLEKVQEGYLPVVLIDNGPWKAALIVESKNVLDEVTLPTERRPRTAFLVEVDKLLKVSDLGKHPDYANPKSS